MASDKTAILYKLPDFKSPECRVSYAGGLFTARAQEEGKAPRYGCTLIFPKSARIVLGKIVEKLLLETPKWNDKGMELFKVGRIKNPFLAGDGKEAHNSKGELNEGMGSDVFFIRPGAGEKFPPAVWWKNPNIPETEKTVYSGCYGKAILNAYSYNHPKSGDGITFGISGFQKLKEGERLGGSGGIDPEKWSETIADEGPAPEETKKGRGAGGLFGETPDDDIPF
jgi:Protein of unknown function (DUF2815)